MAVTKVPLDPTRLRQIPLEGFSWIDRRFVRAGCINRLSPEAILLYFFLATVSDAQGLSFYADPTIGKILKLNPEELTQARARLVAAELILYRYPLYQVLELPRALKDVPRSPPIPCPAPTLGSDPLTIGKVLEAAKTPGKST